MKPLSTDAMCLIATIATKYVVNVIKPYAKKYGSMNDVQHRNLNHVIKLHKRMAKGKYEASVNEVGQLLDAAQMLNDMYADISGTNKKTIARDVPAMFSKATDPQFSYSRVIEECARGLFN